MKKKLIEYKPETMEDRANRKAEYYSHLVRTHGPYVVLLMLTTIIEELKAAKCAYPRCP